MDEDPQGLVVRRVHGEAWPARGVEDHEVPAGGEECRRRSSDRERQRRARGLEALAERVDDLGRERHAVGGPSPRPAADHERVAPGLDLQSRQIGLDPDVLLAEPLRVERVRERHAPRVERRAPPGPAALVARHAERPVGAEGPLLRLARAPRPLGGGCARGERDADRRVRGQGLRGAHGDEAPRQGRLREARHRLVRVHLVRCGEAQRRLRPPGAHAQRGQDRGGVDRLVERREENGVAARGPALGVAGNDPRGRGRERPRHGGGQGGTRSVAGAGGDLHAVLGGHREARLGREDERPGAHPAPLAGRLRDESDGHALPRERLVSGEGDHRSGERDGEMRGERHVALRHPTDDRERARVARHRPRERGRGERGHHHAARARRGQRRLAQGEGLLARLLGEGREPVDDAACLGVGQWLGGGARDGRGALRSRLALAQAEDEASLLGGRGARPVAPPHRGLLADLRTPRSCGEKRGAHGDERAERRESCASHRLPPIRRRGYRRCPLRIPPSRARMSVLSFRQEA